MQAALLDAVLLPPPAAGALVLAGLGGAGAGGAADRRVALAVERVQRQGGLACVSPDLVPSPFRQWRDLGDAAMGGVGGRDGGGRPGGALVAAEAGDPGVVALEGGGQRPRLADLAAVPAELDRPQER